MLRILAALCLLLPVAAQTDGFAQWFGEFRIRVAHNDAFGVAKGAHFPMNWENGPVREIKTQDDFVKNFAKYFTPDIRKAIATQTPGPAAEGTRMITWKARGNEYSVYFKAEGSTYVLNGLSEGPP